MGNKTEDKTDKTINDLLPEEILLETFGYLSAADLQNATQVCKKWNNIISNNSSTMKHLPLVLSSFTFKNVQEAMELKRKYFKITLQNVTLNSETAHNLNNILKVIEKHGSIVRQFVVKNADLTHDILLPILQCLLQLEKITLDDVMLKTDGFSVDTLKTDENVLELKYLKQIVWHKADINLLRFLDTSKVFSIKQASTAGLLDSAGRKYLTMQELAITRCDSLPPYEDIRCLLKKLSIIPTRDDEVFISWMDALKDSLEALDIAGFLSLSTYAFLFETLRKLQLLKLNAESLPMMEDKSGKKLKPNLNVKTLILYSKHGCDNNVESFIGNLPNLESLVLKCDLQGNDSNRLMTFISNNLTKLRLLEIRSLDDGTFKNVNIPTLRKLHIHYYGGEDQITGDGLETIAINCPNIKQLSIEHILDSFRLLANEILIITTNLKKLQRLYIGDGFVASQETFNHFRNHPELKLIMMMKNALDEDSTMINDITQNGPQIMLLEKPAHIFRTDFNLWENEDVDIGVYSDEDDHSLFSVDDNELDDFDDAENWYDGYDDDDSDENFSGAFRPG